MPLYYRVSDLFLDSNTRHIADLCKRYADGRESELDCTDRLLAADGQYGRDPEEMLISFEEAEEL